MGRSGSQRELPDDAATLFRVPPEGFVAARDALVERLRSEGRGDDALAVKAVRKPTLTVWALNQLAERDPDGVGALLDAGSELRAAQQAAVSAASGADRLREATTARRRVVSRLIAAAIDALQEAGRGAGTHADVIGPALETASVEPEIGRRLTAGTLEQLPSEPAGFGDIFGLTGLPGGGGESADDEAGPPERGSAELKEEAARLGRERDAAAEAARKDREAADRLEHELTELRRRAAEIETELTAARTRARASELEAKRAERDLSRTTLRREP